MFSLSAPALPPSLNHRSQRLGFVCLAGAVPSALVSIALSQMLLAGAAAGFLWEASRQRRADWRVPPVAWPLLFFFLWTVVTALLAPDMLRALGELKKFFLYFILLLVPWVARGAGIRAWLYRLIFGVAAVSAAVGLAQYVSNPGRDALHRISGFMSHWMTYSGTLMLVLTALGAYALCYGLRRTWWALPCGALIAASIYVSQTRNALLGAAAGLAVILLLLRRYGLIALLALVLAAAYLVSPASIQQRLRAGFDPNDPNTRNRIELFETAGRLIADNPWFGVGPKNVNVEALRYRGNHDYPDWMYQHMHNNFLQIAAERGIPGLILWLWLVGRLGWDAWAAYRQAGLKSRGAPPSEAVLESRMVSVAALGVWTALLVAGMFEYNFGDSEVLTLFLFFSGAIYSDSLPFRG